MPSRKQAASLFGRHVHSLRRARRWTQEQLAELCGLSPDTISRLEGGDFSPSLETLRKLTAGLEIQLSTLFLGYEAGERVVDRELVDLLTGRPRGDVELGLRLLRLVFAELDARRRES